MIKLKIDRKLTILITKSSQNSVIKYYHLTEWFAHMRKIWICCSNYYFQRSKNQSETSKKNVWDVLFFGERWHLQNKYWFSSKVYSGFFSQFYWKTTVFSEIKNLYLRPKPRRRGKQMQKVSCWKSWFLFRCLSLTQWLLKPKSPNLFQVRSARG